jgi:hypothetical protein
MIKYLLRCAHDHEFEGWFGSMADYDSQAADGLLECPFCGTAEVGKAIMAPRISSGAEATSPAMREAFGRAMRRARDYVEKHYDYVGERFPEEARRIHYGESDARRIYGEATGAEVRELISEGVAVSPVPGAPAQDRAGPQKPVLSKAAKPGRKKPVN